MTQIKSLSSDVDKNDAIHLRTDQINELVNMYRSGKLNQNSPIKDKFNFQLQKDWPFVTLTHKILDL